MLEAVHKRFVFHFATTYSDLGFSLIALNGKVPAIPSWKEFQLRRATEDELRRWFSGKGCKHNLGIVTGRISDLVVVDADTPTDATWWLENYPRSPLQVNTGRGGVHIYYRHPGNEIVGNRAKLFHRAIDLRGDGGYVVAPNSIHPGTGKEYSWRDAALFSHYSLSQIPVFDPAWLATGKEKESPASLDSVAFPNSLRSWQTERRIRGLLRHLEKEVSDRSARDFAVVCGLIELGCTPDEVSTLVSGNSKFRDNPKYLELTLKNALRKAVRDPFK